MTNIIHWMVIPGRKVAHAFRPLSGTKRMHATCGQCAMYPEDHLTAAFPNAVRCQMCEITLATNMYCMVSKFFMDHVPASERAIRRKKWRAFREACRQDSSHEARVLQLPLKKESAP